MKAVFVISAGLLTVVGAMAQGIATTNFRQYDTGTVSITQGQTARFNVLYPTIPAPFAAQTLCSASLVIADNQNGVLKTLAVSQLVGGRSVSLELNADTELPPGTSHGQIHAVVLSPTPGTAGTGCLLVPTLEVVDNLSGKTTVVVKGEPTWPQTIASFTTAVLRNSAN